MSDRLIDRLLFAALWIGLLAYALLFAPPLPADLLAQLSDLLLARTGSVDPIAIAVFNLLGVLPTAFLALLLFETGRPSPWPFALGSFAFGGFILLPYLVLRDTRAPLNSTPGVFARVLGSRTTGAVLLVIALSLVGFGAIAGHPSAFVAQFRSSGFIAVMSIDLLVLTLALHRVTARDRRRRGLRLSHWLSLAARAPLLGPLLYLAVREPL